MEMLALIPERYTTNPTLPSDDLVAVTSFITHQFIHGDWSHLILNAAWLLAFGSAVAARLGTWRFVVFALLSGIAGALTFIAFHLQDQTIMVGASGALAGLMGGAFRFLFVALDYGPDAFRASAPMIPRMTIAQLFRDKRAVIAIGIWIVINFVTALIAPLLTSAGGIAWEAHLGGFAFGLFTFGWFDNRPVPVEMEDEKF